MVTRFRRRRRHRLARWLGGAALAFVLALAGGLLWFVDQIPRTLADDTRTTDAIVVLTGGAGRLAAGLALLAERRAKKLFVSGVYRGVDVAEILRLSREAPDELRCCIDLGHDAVDTRGNARETAAWMAREGFRSLRLVTASYHMPRSLLEFRRLMPDVEIVPHPVISETVHVADWWRWPGSASLIASEFGKYALALILAPRR